MTGANSQTAREGRKEAESVKELLTRAPWFSRWFRRSDLLRVATAIGLMEIKLRHYRELCGPSPCLCERSVPAGGESGFACGGLTAADLDACNRLLGEAKKALEIGSVDSAWMYLNELDREMLPALSDEELTARLTSAVEEAREKLGKWRGCAVPKLSIVLGLEDEPGPGTPVAGATGPLPEGRRQATLTALR